MSVGERKGDEGRRGEGIGGKGRGTQRQRRRGAAAAIGMGLLPLGWRTVITRVVVGAASLPGVPCGVPWGAIGVVTTLPWGPWGSLGLSLTPPGPPPGGLGVEQRTSYTNLHFHLA